MIRGLRLTGMLIMLMMTLLFSGCRRQPLTIGLLGTMTGPNSDLSISGRRGAEIAVDEINQSGGLLGRALQLSLIDDENDKQIAMAGLNTCADEGVKLVIGPYTSGMITPNIEQVNALDILLLGPTISADELSGKDDNFIRFIASTEEQATILAWYITKMSLQRVAILSDSRNEGFASALIQNFEQKIKQQMGIEVSVLRFNPQHDSAIETVVEEVKILNPDGVFIIASAEDLAHVAQRVYQEAIDVQLFGPLWANTPELMRKGGEAVEGVIVVGGIDPENDNPAFNAFYTTFTERYGEAPTFASVYSYETVRALAKAVEKANSTEPEAVKTALIEIGSYEGLQGVYQIDANGDNTRAYMLFQNVEGEMRKVD
ncbi:MAG: branched-chain amino acid transport system substrate-binding protein [Clostridiales bacterium]|nr:branched-chain amino acid transport system substrate-binding protein [Clostridiales bacterium]